MQSSSLVRNAFSKSALSNVLETSKAFPAKEHVSYNSLLEGLCYEVAVNDSRALSVVAPRNHR
jgi:hypothetical protein